MTTQVWPAHRSEVAYVQGLRQERLARLRKRHAKEIDSFLMQRLELLLSPKSK